MIYIIYCGHRPFMTKDIINYVDFNQDTQEKEIVWESYRSIKLLDRIHVFYSNFLEQANKQNINVKC